MKMIRKTDRMICRTLPSKKIILTNAIELNLPSTVKIHPVVNVSRVYRYKDQVEGCHGLNHNPELSRILPKISQHT